ncbi:hypothetical protein K525DRAFT_246345 [Schizophyllum commune Loenen D]|nr:hypothetical protein K525DRAFT_246345 [Schizophyllum commune Loenen D]
MTPISNEFTAYLKTVDLSKRLFPATSASATLSPETLVKLLLAEQALPCLVFEPTQGRRLVCEFKGCSWTRNCTLHDVLFPQRYRMEIEAHVEDHLEKLGQEKLWGARLWHQVPIRQSSEGLDMLPCFYQCWELESVPQGSKLAEHLALKHYDGHAMYSCPLCNMDFALDAEEGVPKYVQKDMTLLSTIPLPKSARRAAQDLEAACDATAGPHDATAGHHVVTVSQPQATDDLLQDISDIKAQILLLNHYELGCPALMSINAPRWEEFPDDVREHLEGQLKTLAPKAEGACELDAEAPLALDAEWQLDSEALALNSEALALDVEALALDSEWQLDAEGQFEIDAEVQLELDAGGQFELDADGQFELDAEMQDAASSQPGLSADELALAFLTHSANQS